MRHVVWSASVNFHSFFPTGKVPTSWFLIFQGVIVHPFFLSKGTFHLFYHLKKTSGGLSFCQPFRKARSALLKLGREQNDIQELSESIQRRQSQEAGVSVAYLQSEEFLKEVYSRCTTRNPTFYALKDAFFYGDEPMPLGKDRICPRDGRYGCALVDTLSPRFRRKSTHYLSWTWKYTVSLVQDSLQCFLHESNATPDSVFLYMCFFVNNQYRILFEKDGIGSTNLEQVFESTLSRIGRMVAILDDWYCPVYLTRIWTIFEQFTAIKLGNINVTMVLPAQQNQTLIAEIREGEEGIRHVTQRLCQFQSKHATAFSPADEANVKKLIKSTIGFREVDRRIEQFMLNWVGNVVQEQLDEVEIPCWFVWSRNRIDLFRWNVSDLVHTTMSKTRFMQQTWRIL